MSEHKQALYFKSPVDEIWPQLKDAYFRLVQQPMDMRTVTDKLTLPVVDGQSYTSPWQFFRDMNLIFENALIFNIPNDAVYKSAVFMQAWQSGHDSGGTTERGMQKQFRSRHWPKCRQRMEKAGLNLQHPDWGPPSEAGMCRLPVEAPSCGNGSLVQPCGVPTAAEPRGGGGGSSSSHAVRTGALHCSPPLRPQPVQDDAARVKQTELLQAEHVGVLAVSTWLLCSARPALQHHHCQSAFPPPAPSREASGSGSRAWLLLTATALIARLSMALQAVRHLPAVAAAEEQLLRAFRKPMPGRSSASAHLPSFRARPQESRGAAAAAASECTPSGGGEGSEKRHMDEAPHSDTTATAAAAPSSPPASDSLLQPADAPRAHNLEEAAGLLEASSGGLREVAQDLCVLLEQFGWDADVRCAVGACQEELEAGRQLLEQVRCSVADELGPDRCRPDAAEAGCQGPPSLGPPSLAEAALLLRQLPDLLQPEPGGEEGEALRQLMALLREQQQHMDARERLRLLSNRLRLRGVDPDMLLRGTSAAAGRGSHESAS